jgi:chorismate--pyruvate lyase
MEDIKSLLYTEGSLTEALSAALASPIQVDVLREITRPCNPEESERLQDNTLWQRDVVLRGQGPLILARTRVSSSQPSVPLEVIQQLGTRPLGEWLYQQRNLRKLSFEVNEAKSRRDTVYDLNGARIWVQEIFI